MKFETLIKKTKSFIVDFFTNEKIKITIVEPGKVEPGEGYEKETVAEEVKPEPKPKRTRKTPVKSPVEKKVAVKRARKKVEE